MNTLDALIASTRAGQTEKPYNPMDLMSIARYIHQLYVEASKTMGPDLGGHSVLEVIWGKLPDVPERTLQDAIVVSGIRGMNPNVKEWDDPNEWKNSGNTWDSVLGVRAQTERQEPYSYELNKIRPKTIAPSFETSKNIGDFPDVPEEVKPEVDNFINGLKKLAELEANIKQQQALLQSMLQSQMQEKDELKTKLNEVAQTLGPKIQQIDVAHDTVVAKLSNMFIAASQLKIQTGTTSLDPEAQIELLKGIMRQVNAHFSEEVISRFEAALAQFKIVNTVVKRTVRVWPATQEQMQGKALKNAAIRILWGQVSDEAFHILSDLRDMITSGLSGMLEIDNLIQDGLSGLTQKPEKSNNILQMPQQAQPVAAQIGNSRGKQMKQLLDWINQHGPISARFEGDPNTEGNGIIVSVPWCKLREDGTYDEGSEDHLIYSYQDARDVLGY